MLGFINDGGPLMYVLLLCSAVAIAIFFERLFYLAKMRKKMKILEDELNTIDIKDENKISELLEDKKDNILAKLYYKALQEKGNSIEWLRGEVEKEAMRETPKLEKNISALGVIYNIAPMLGLLGTVIGLSTTLQDLVSDPDKLLNGINIALITTITGLIIAIPVHIAHNYLNSRVNKIILDLETKSSNFIEKIKHKSA